MLASLPMYDLPEIRQATKTLWQGFARHFGSQGITPVPDQLVHEVPVKQLWTDKRLFFSQCCGYDVEHGYKNQVKVIATPQYIAPGCSGHDYVSLIVVHEDSHYSDISEMFDAIAVINGPESHSGMNALMSLAAPFSRNGQFFSQTKISGGHIQSLSLLQKKLADVASIDSITYTLLKQYRPHSVENTRILGTTYSAPAPPYITHIDTGDDVVAQMQLALVNAFNDPQLHAAKQTLLLDGLDIQTEKNYTRINQEFFHDFHVQIS